MPELPEVQTIVDDLAPRLLGRRLSRPRLHHTNVLRGVSRARLLKQLAGARVAAVERRAKHVVLRFDDGHRVVIHPRMTGAMMVYARRLTAEERRYAVLEALIGDGERFVYRDVRRLGTIMLLDDRAWASYTARIGPEPLDPEFDVARFTDRLQGTRRAIKKVIMDQRKIAGVGNIYANEALFEAGIDPSRPADRLSDEDIGRLHVAIRAILTRAIASRGSTVRDYRTGTGGAGSFQFKLHVYGRGGEACVRCGARLATTHAIDGRATTFCWRCQGRRRA